MKDTVKRKRLVIISHTEHYYDGAEIKGLGPTVNEINFLSNYWEEVVHVACFHKGKSPKSMVPYTGKNIKYVKLPSYGGKSILSKLLIIFKMPSILFIIFRNLRGASEVQVRLPTAIGVFLLPLLCLRIYSKSFFWVKYAGAWKSKNLPLSNQFQRFFLVRNIQNCPVTINGFYLDQPKHCFSFENPSLFDFEILLGKEVALKKLFKKPFTLVFIGRIEKEKGMSEIVQSLRKIPAGVIDKVHFIGDGQSRVDYERDCGALSIETVFHGFLSRSDIHQILKSSDFLLLPSYSEGFPKVISEAACYGVIPIVSDVGSISHYVNDLNGFVCNAEDMSNSFNEKLEAAVYSSPEVLKRKSNSILNIATLFTFESYYRKLNIEIFR
jgi:glycosyltransferase involved in cell wall biosynthesis